MVDIKRILCPIDFSAFSLDALRHGLGLAHWYSAQITALHVHENSNSRPDPLDQTVIEEVRRFCSPVLAASGQDMEVVVRRGDAATQIREQAERQPADLLILGTHGRSGFQRLFLGSVTEKVLRSTRVPVLTIPPPVREPGSPLYRTLLCPLDFSDASIRALEYALSLAQEANAHLILLHVIDDLLNDVRVEDLGHVSLLEHYRQLERSAALRLKTVVPDGARVWSQPEERVVQGRAYREILKVVADERVDMVVMGVQGKSAVNLVFGSTTHRVIRDAPCPVLTLHTPTPVPA